MNHTKLSICYHPTTTLLVEDNRDFLNKIELLLAYENLPSVSYSDSQKALQFLNESYHPSSFLKRCFNYEIEINDAEEEISHTLFDFSFSKIHHEIYDQKRFNQISVLVADYDMPALNGLDLSRQIKEKLFQILILTGEAGPMLAVQAFNENVINQYIQKSAMDLNELLLKSLRGLQHKHFFELSDIVLARLPSIGMGSAPACLKDKLFIERFNQLCADHHIVEYYLLDEHGSFLLLDKKATPSWLIVKNEEVMQAEYEAADGADNTPTSVLKALKERTGIPYLHTKEDWAEGVFHPEKFMHPATLLKGDQPYYYAYITKPDAYALERDKILSFEKFMENASG